MASPTTFPGVNKTLAIEGQEKESHLPVMFQDGVWTSRWSLTPIELEKVNETGAVWLRVAIDGPPPPVAVDGIAPIHYGDAATLFIVLNDRSDRLSKIEQMINTVPLGLFETDNPLSKLITLIREECTSD